MATMSRTTPAFEAAVFVDAHGVGARRVRLLKMLMVTSCLAKPLWDNNLAPYKHGRPKLDLRLANLAKTSEFG